MVGRTIRPQIAKDYVESQVRGRPDLGILENFERGDKFYEQQYSDVNSMNIKFRETESQIKHDETVAGEILGQQASQLYDSFF